MLSIHLALKKEVQCNLIYGPSNPVEVAIKTFEQHPSIYLIKKNMSNTTTFNFLPAEIDGIIKKRNL